MADPPWGVAPLPCSPPFPARSLAIATMRRGDGERQGREGGGRGGGKGEKGVAAPCDGGRRGTGAGRVRGGCGYWRGSRQAGAAGQIPPQRIRSGRPGTGRPSQGALGGACKGVGVGVGGVVHHPPPGGRGGPRTSRSILRRRGGPAGGMPRHRAGGRATAHAGARRASSWGSGGRAHARALLALRLTVIILVIGIILVLLMPRARADLALRLGGVAGVGARRGGCSACPHETHRRHLPPPAPRRPRVVTAPRGRGRAAGGLDSSGLSGLSRCAQFHGGVFL